ncbi:MAG TPA: glycosyl hydrolase [Solirubrobacteraceae bacterium]
MLLTCAPLTSQAATVTVSPSTLAVYTGGGNAGGFTSFSNWLGQRPVYATDFLAGGSWSEIEQPSWFLKQWAGVDTQAILSVPMLPGSGATLAQGATGAYNSYFTTLARSLVSNGDSDAILRLGWEMNGNWFPWSIENGNAANYAAYWRQIVTAMRAVSPGFRFDFCVNGGSSTVSGKLLNPEEAYPGDEYVNYIGLDAYDNSWVSNASVFANRWKGWLTQSYGLEWQRKFAAAHGKQVSFPEWGLSNGEKGGGDDPQFIQSMYEWMASSNLAYESYFDFDESNADHELEDFPKSEAVYKQLFSAPGGEAVAPAPESKSEPKPEPKSEPKPEPKSEPEPELKSEPEPGPESEAQPESKSEKPEEPKGEAPQESKSESASGPKAEAPSKAEPKEPSQSKSTTGTKSEQPSGAKSEQPSRSQPEKASGTKVEQSSGSKSSQGTSSKPEQPSGFKVTRAPSSKSKQGSSSKASRASSSKLSLTTSKSTMGARARAAVARRRRRALRRLRHERSPRHSRASRRRH